MFSPVLFYLILLATLTFQASDLITTTCDRTLYKDFCKSALGSASASDLQGLTKFALNLASSNGVAIHKKIVQIANSTKDEFIQECLNDCSEVYQDAIDQLEDSTGAVDAEGYGDVNTWVSAAMTDVQSCEEGFKGKDGIQSPLTDDNTNFTQLCSIILTMSNLLASN